ncbi:uncharacterized protein LOC126835608 isoform X2 [Adelges cooleyi]|uniref:uncharacterized protein LOC126835608 isoform X2 n=1 Tax=Adelges cooleyi TaxID=133065 RepID=UPI0021800604|nr:uncharacterized protein LOC126835608 isoform X2 [Adelges cooleyi]
MPSIIILTIFVLVFTIPFALNQLRKYLDEFGFDNTQPLNLDTMKELINIIIETKICSKYEKPVPPPTVEIHSIIYAILSCLFCAVVGYILGIEKRHKLVCSIKRNIFKRNGVLHVNNFDNEPSICSVCLDVFKPRMVLLPCKHLCICANCWEQFHYESELICPICREYIEDVLDVYPT